MLVQRGQKKKEGKNRPCLFRFSPARTHVCMCARARRRAAWFTAPNNLCCLHRGDFPLHTSFTFGSQCGFCEIGPFRFLCRVIYFCPGSWIDSGEERRADRPSFSWVSSLVSPVRSVGRFVEHLQSTLTLPRQPFVINTRPLIAKCRTSICVRSVSGLDGVNPINV